MIVLNKSILKVNEMCYDIIKAEIDSVISDNGTK